MTTGLRGSERLPSMYCRECLVTSSSESRPVAQSHRLTTGSGNAWVQTDLKQSFKEVRAQTGVWAREKQLRNQAVRAGFCSRRDGREATKNDRKEIRKGEKV